MKLHWSPGLSFYILSQRMKGEEVRKSNVLASPYYEPDTVKHFKWLISFIWERFFFSKNVMPLSAEHHSPIASSFSIWLLSAALHLSRSPVTPMLLPLMYTFWISSYLISWQHLTVAIFSCWKCCSLDTILNGFSSYPLGIPLSPLQDLLLLQTSKYCSCVLGPVCTIVFHHLISSHSFQYHTCWQMPHL